MNVDKSLRPYCFCVFSDIFISCGDYIAKYLGGILELVTKALEAASVPVKEDVNNDKFKINKNKTLFLFNFFKFYRTTQIT